MKDIRCECVSFPLALVTSTIVGGDMFRVGKSKKRTREPYPLATLLSFESKIQANRNNKTWDYCTNHCLCNFQLSYTMII